MQLQVPPLDTRNKQQVHDFTSSTRWRSSLSSLEHENTANSPSATDNATLTRMTRTLPHLRAQFTGSVPR
jgi:hypothetical protein